MNQFDDRMIADIIKVTAPNLTPEDFLKAQSMMKQTNEIIGHCLAGSIKLTQQIVDMDRAIIFPIFSNDNLESLITRYVKLYPIEASALMEEVKTRLNENEYGFSNNKLMKFKVSIPATIIAAGKALSADFWEANNGKQIENFIVLCPKLASKNKHDK